MHTLSKHNRDALLNGSQHTYAWRVYCNRTKPYWYPNTAHYMHRVSFLFISPTSVVQLSFSWSSTPVLLGYMGHLLCVCGGGGRSSHYPSRCWHYRVSKPTLRLAPYTCTELSYLGLLLPQIWERFLHAVYLCADCTAQWYKQETGSPLVSHRREWVTGTSFG